MEYDMEKAKRILREEQYTCVFVKEDKMYVSRERGVKPLLVCLRQKKMESGFFAADKVVGKAAAFLYVLLGAAELYADVISKPALAVLNNSGIKVQYETLTDAIINRAGTGFCPMETAVLTLEDATEALTAIETTLSALQK